MAVSAFKSTSRRATQTNPSPSISSSSNSTRNPSRRSRSVSAVRRRDTSEEDEFKKDNTIDNPLFDCSGVSSSKSSETERSGIGKGRIGRGVAAKENSARQRVRSVSRGPSSYKCPSRSNESDCPSSTDTEEGRICETVRSEVQRAVSQIRDDLQNVIKGKNGEISSDFHTDIRTDYTTELEKSQERILKLRAELAFEEQKKVELNKVLKEVISPESSQGLIKTKPKRRMSIEKHEVSRRLEEEAMSYFEECVSISNFDGSDLSSLEEPNPLIDTHKSGISNPVIETRESGTGISNPFIETQESETQESGIGIFLSNEEIAFAESLISNDEPNFFEDSENQTPRSIRTIGSDNYASEFNTSSENFHFSFTQKSLVESTTKNYLENFAKEKNVRYNKEDYVMKGQNENLINERVVFRNRLQSGGILICDIRTF